MGGRGLRRPLFVIAREGGRSSIPEKTTWPERPRRAGYPPGMTTFLRLHSVAQWLTLRVERPLRRQRLFQIRDQVFLVLDADRQADDVGCSAGFHLGGVVELAVGGRGRVNHQRTGVADI